jgi:hypothetical protein
MWDNSAAAGGANPTDGRNTLVTELTQHQVAFPDQPTPYRKASRSCPTQYSTTLLPFKSPASPKAPAARNPLSAGDHRASRISAFSGQSRELGDDDCNVSHRPAELTQVSNQHHLQIDTSMLDVETISLCQSENNPLPLFMDAPAATRDSAS